MFASLASALGLSLVYKWLPGDLLYTYNPYVDHNEVSADRIESGVGAAAAAAADAAAAGGGGATPKALAERRAASGRRRARRRPPSPSRATRRPISRRPSMWVWCLRLVFSV